MINHSYEVTSFLLLEANHSVYIFIIKQYYSNLTKFSNLKRAHHHLMQSKRGKIENCRSINTISLQSIQYSNLYVHVNRSFSEHRKLTGKTSLAISSTTAFASAKGNRPAKEPLPAIRKRPELYNTIRSTPPASSNFAEIPVPAPAPIMGNPFSIWSFSFSNIV